VNPYQPPAAEAAHNIDDNPSDRLWHVSDGQLRVRDGANLPDICLSGASPGESGERKILVLSWCPAWVRYLPAIAILGWMLWIAAYSFEDPKVWAALVGVALLAVLCWRLSKRGRLHLFQSDQAKRNESRRSWIEALVVFAVIMGLGLLMGQINPGELAKGGGGLIGGLFSFFVVNLKNRRSVRSCGFKSGWFVLANVNPAAIAWLAEIQNHPDEPPLSGKPS
jgi:hypothetical protein